MFKELDKNNLHHAYLIEGDRIELVEEIIKFSKTLGVETAGSEDFTHIHLDTFKIEDARNLKSLGSEKGYSENKKIFVISTNSFLLEAQNALLKIFEEPIANTIFFVMVPDVGALLKTFVSRFYLVTPKSGVGEDKEAEKFLKLPLAGRIDFLKQLLAEEETEEAVLDSARSRASKFLNSLESALHSKMSKVAFDTSCFEQIFKARKFVRQPGSSIKSLMESVAFTAPIFKN